MDDCKEPSLLEEVENPAAESNTSSDNTVIEYNNDCVAETEDYYDGSMNPSY